MSEQKSYATIEEAINDLLEGEQKENAMNLAAYLKDNNMSPIMENWAKIKFDDYYIGRMGIEGKDDWCFEVFSSLHYQYGYEDDDMDFIKAVHDRVQICNAPCHDECWRAKDVITSESNSSNHR